MISLFTALHTSTVYSEIYKCYYSEIFMLHFGMNGYFRNILIHLICIDYIM